jgi:hypothetical protein
MMINDEKAPAFSAKTLNLPQPAEDHTAQIIELSRQRYSQDRGVVDELVRKAAGLDAANPTGGMSVPQPQLRTKAQVQLNTADALAPKSDSHRIGKVAAGLFKGPPAGQTTANTDNASVAPKRRRTRRGKRKGSQQPAEQAKGPAETVTATENEQVIRLR